MSLAEVEDEQVDRARARIGRTLQGKWRLDALLGLGGLAAVYAATHRNGKRVAVKLLHPELAHEAQIKARFLREGYAANAVGHPGTVSVLDDDATEEGNVFLVMELLEGETVAERSDRTDGKLGALEVLRIAGETLDVLEAAHAKGILHRDLKPSNLFLALDGRVKVLDFGIAQVREGSSKKLTQTGVAMGTPGFMSPEQARGQWDDVDERTDLWAVGATMWTLLAGRTLHEAPTTAEQIVAAMSTPAPPIASVVPGLAPSVARLVDRAVAFAKEARYPSATEMRAAVCAAQEELLAPPGPATATPTATVMARAAPVSPTEEAESSTERVGHGAGDLRRRLMIGAGIFLFVAGTVALSLVMRSLVLPRRAVVPVEAVPTPSPPSPAGKEAAAPSAPALPFTVDKSRPEGSTAAGKRDESAAAPTPGAPAHPHIAVEKAGARRAIKLPAVPPVVPEPLRGAPEGADPNHAAASSPRRPAAPPDDDADLLDRRR